MAEDKLEVRRSKHYQIIYSELIQAAKYRGTVTYQEIAKIMDLPLRGSYMAAKIGDLIGEISKEEVSHGRPMLSTIVVGVSGYPGEGFYKWAKEIGRFKGETEEEKLEFWENEKKEVYETWKTPLKT